MVTHTFNVGLRKQRQGDLFEFQASQCELKENLQRNLQRKFNRKSPVGFLCVCCLCEYICHVGT